MNAIISDISIIIPCYNTGPAYLQDAVDSVFAYKGKHSYEIIITDDGSTNSSTLDLLKSFKEKGINVLYQENRGPAAARNTGVQYSNSDYLLFLDSDNRIMPEYIDEGIKALEVNLKAGVAYGNPRFIGETSERNFQAAPFDIRSILLENYIDTCAVVRKKAWLDAGGMDEARLLIGHEDWEFWISLYKAGWQFIHINKTLFEYRIAAASLITQTNKDDFYNKLGYIYQKHWKIVYESYLNLYGQSLTLKNDMQRPLRSFLKYSKKKYLS